MFSTFERAGTLMVSSHIIENGITRTAALYDNELEKSRITKSLKKKKRWKY